MAGFYTELYNDIIVNSRETLKVGVPALLYVVQNNLLFYALSRLDAATYQVPLFFKYSLMLFFAFRWLQNA